MEQTDEATTETASNETASNEAAIAAELARIRERATAVRDAEVERARSRLRARGDLSPEQRAIVEALADRIVERVLAAPARRLAKAEDRAEVAEDVRALFDD